MTEENVPVPPSPVSALGGLKVVAPPQAPPPMAASETPSLAAMMSAMQGMAPIPVQPEPVVVGPAPDVASILADMPDVSDAAPTGLAPGAFQPQPPITHAVAAPQAQEPPRKRKREEPEDDGPDEPDNRAPVEVVADAANELGGIAADIEEGEVKNLADLKVAVQDIADEMSDALFALLRMQEQAMSIVATPEGPVPTAVLAPPQQQPQEREPGMSPQDASVLYQTVMAGVSMVQILSAAHAKEWDKLLRSVSPEVKQVLMSIVQSMPQMAQVSADIIHRASGIDINTFVSQIPQEQLAEASRLTGVDVGRMVKR